MVSEDLLSDIRGDKEPENSGSKKTRRARSVTKSGNRKSVQSVEFVKVDSNSGAPPTHSKPTVAPAADSAVANGAAAGVEPRVATAPAVANGVAAGVTSAADTGVGAGVSVAVDNVSGRSSDLANLATGTTDDPQTANTLPKASTQVHEKVTLPAPRRVHVTVQRINPLSTATVVFPLSLVLGIVLTVSVIFLWVILNVTGMFSSIANWASGSGFSSGQIDIMGIFGFGNVLAFMLIFSVILALVMTVLSVIFALIYNLITSLVGGLRITLGDD
jgi:hypothetical protein